MNNDLALDANAAHGLLAALEQQLGAVGQSYDIVVVGGAALLALDLVRRTTRDIDIVALSQAGELISAVDLPAALEPLRQALAYFGIEDVDLGD